MLLCDVVCLIYLSLLIGTKRMLSAVGLKGKALDETAAVAGRLPLIDVDVTIGRAST